MKSKSEERNEIKNEGKQNFKGIIFSATTNININTDNVNIHYINKRKWLSQ